MIYAIGLCKDSRSNWRIIAALDVRLIPWGRYDERGERLKSLVS